MSSRRPSYAQTTSKSVSTAPAKHVFTTSDSTHHTKPNIEKWVKENINLSSKPRRGSQIIGQIKNDSERLVTVLRKGKVYISRPKAPGELNARERRKVRRALAREAKEQELEAADASDPSPDAENDELDLCIHSPGSLDDCIRPLPHDVDTQPLAQDTMQRLQDAFSAYNPFGPRAHQFPAASSTPTRPSNAHVPPDIHAPNTSLEYKGSGHRTPSPRTPSPSSLSYEDAPGEISLASPDAALYASRRPSLNVGATPFIPNRICPLTPRTPCRSRSGSMFSPDAPSAASGSSPEDAQSTNGSGRCSRRHSVALAAWEAMQRRLSAKYDTPEYKPLPLPPSTINTDVDLAHPSAPFSAISPNSSLCFTSPGIAQRRWADTLQENILEHVGGPDADIESTLRQFQEAIAKYRYMEMNLTQRKKGLLEKIPDIEKTLAMVRFLKDKREGKSKASEDDLEDDDDLEKPKSQIVTYELNDTLFAEAEVDTSSDVVYLWLGANVMLSYTQDQAIELLSTKLVAAKQSLTNAKEDLEFLREQITVMEVNTARTYNWDVRRRREARLKAESEPTKI
ncbi:hypothetical protein FRB99_006705 [Tulasnella sp. 403]|nr:hypothetical protein FRB99_006705 [Tulasnella sp. 403]